MVDWKSQQLCAILFMCGSLSANFVVFISKLHWFVKKIDRQVSC